MNTSHELAAFGLAELRPGEIINATKRIIDSGLTTVILGLLHIGRPMKEFPKMVYGDLIYNDYEIGLLVSEGKFNPQRQPFIDYWPGEVAALKGSSSSVKRIFISIGGQGNNNIFDFRTIQWMLNSNQGEVLRDNFKTLRDAFTINGACVIDGIDLDCEEPVEDLTIIDFSKMLFDLGFEVTFCPYNNRDQWQRCMRELWNQKPQRKVSWWNLQCYDGGDPNRDEVEFKRWIESLREVVRPEDPASYLMPGLHVRNDGRVLGQCPWGNESFYETFGKFGEWSKPGRLRGGWLWSYDSIRDNESKQLCSAPMGPFLRDYVVAIDQGLPVPPKG
jgi:hypothetical protein